MCICDVYAVYYLIYYWLEVNLAFFSSPETFHSLTDRFSREKFQSDRCIRHFVVFFSSSSSVKKTAK